MDFNIFPIQRGRTKLLLVIDIKKQSEFLLSIVLNQYDWEILGTFWQIQWANVSAIFEEYPFLFLFLMMLVPYFNAQKYELKIKRDLENGKE